MPIWQQAAFPLHRDALRMSPWKHASAALAITAALAAVLDAQQAYRTVNAAAVQAAIERDLAVAPRGFERQTPPVQAGVRVLDVDVDHLSPSAQRVTIDLSQKALTYDPAGDVEPIVDQVIRSTAALTGGAGNIKYRFLVDGLPLEMFLDVRRGPLRAAAAGAGRSLAGGDPQKRIAQPAQLVGSLRDPTLAKAEPPRVLLSAGHGWYWNENFGAWHLQRDHYWGIVEDVVNWEFASAVQAALRKTRFDARLARNPDRLARPGPSGHPGWQEGAVYFIKGLGAPADVWNVGGSDYARDINSRPLYANWIDADVVVSIHNNGGGGTGTETWFDETNGYEGESERLAGTLNTHIVNAIRRFYDADWPDRGLRSCNGCKGENRLAARPAVILEIAFMDTKSPDSDALHDENFRRIVAYAIRDGLHAWAGLPLPPDD
jgi:N-acetylmuramoyl-L-alanine amidase